MTRLKNCIADCRPPISLWARWKSGRWIIPEYDILFVPAIVLVATTMACHGVLTLFDAPAEIGVGIQVAILFTIFPFLPPDTKKWRLTGSINLAAANSPGSKTRNDQVSIHRD